MGPVNGIYCWTKKPVPDIEFDSLFLCNPALREVQSVPEIPRRPFVESSKGWYYYPCQTYGFGYDYKTNDYKVVAVTGSNTSAESRGLQIFVYTLSSNSWRRIPMEIDSFPAIPFERPPVLTDGDGVCHWLAKHEQQHLVMLSFDFGSEAFKWSPLPQGYGGPNSNKSLCLSVLNESSIMLIALHDRWSLMEHKIKIGCCYEIFRMNEGGSTGEELWTMLYTIEPIPGIDKPLGFRKNGEIILAKLDGSLVTYDPSCKQMNLLHICRQGFTGNQVCAYMESLISVHGRS